MTDVAAKSFLGRIAPYGVVSAVVTAIDYGVFVAELKFGLYLISANIVSWAIAAVSAYFLHSIFSFETGVSWRKFVGYICVCLTTLIIGTAVLAVSSLYVVPIAAKVVSTIIVFTFSFALSHFTVFRAKL